MNRKVFTLLFILIFLSSGCGSIVDNKYTTTGYGNVTPVTSLKYYVGNPTYVWAGGYFANLTANRLNLFNTNTQISRDGAGNMIFTDAVSGTKTLAQLTVGSGGNVSGSGALNRMTYWDSGSTIGDTSMYFDVPNNRYGIGTTNPELMLHLHDGGSIENGIQMSYTVGSLYSNITSDFLGHLKLNPSGDLTINSGNLSMNTHYINNVINPSQAQDAATKDYVDTAIGSSGNVSTGGGTATYIPKYTSGTNIENSALVDTGHGITTTTNITATQFISTVGGGTPPFVVSSGAWVGNLNVDQVDGLEGNDLLLVDGSHTLTGNLSVDPGVTIDGVDISTLASGGNVTAVGMTTGYIPVATSNSSITNSVATANATGVYVTGQTSTSTLQVGTATPIFPLYSGSGFMSQLQVGGTAILKSADRSVSQLNYGNNATIPEHMGVGSYDYTGNATAERLFTATAPVFDDTDDDGKMILLLSGTYVGAVVEIEHYISTTQVQVTSDNGWTSDLTNETFGILPTPTFGIANSGSARFSMGGESTLAMRSLNATAFAPVSVQVINGGNGVSAFEVDVINGGYNSNEAIDINYITGNMTADTHASILKVSVDKSGASSSTNTTELDFINISQVGRNSSLSHAIHVGQGFDTALTVSGGTRIDPSYGYQVTAAHAVTDRVTGVPQPGTAFLDTSTSNVQIFPAQNNYILLGSTSVFESIPVYLTTGSSHNILPTFYYSTGAGTWSTLVVSDTTGGFVTNGILSFNAPVAWATTNVTTPAGTAITNGYYVKVVRTRATVTTPPTESYFKLYTSSSLTDFMIRGNGTIRPVQMSNAAAPNDSIYYSTTDAKLVFKDAGGTVRSLY